MKIIDAVAMAVFGAVVAAGFILSAAMVSQPDEVKVVPAGDFAAVALVNCGELVVVQFINFEGKGQLDKIRSPAHAMDTQLRLSRVAYERVFWIESDLDCPQVATVL